MFLQKCLLKQTYFIPIKFMITCKGGCSRSGDCRTTCNLDLMIGIDEVYRKDNKYTNISPVSPMVQPLEGLNVRIFMLMISLIYTSKHMLSRSLITNFKVKNQYL